jgi:hypothetical protein
MSVAASCRTATAQQPMEEVDVDVLQARRVLLLRREVGREACETSRVVRHAGGHVLLHDRSVAAAGSSQCGVGEDCSEDEQLIKGP